MKNDRGKVVNAARTMILPRVTMRPSMTKAMSTLAENGWAKYTPDSFDIQRLTEDLWTIGNMLGKPVAGRNGALMEDVCPKNTTNAHPRSLSSKFGLNRLPFHVELCHRLKPCRYLLLGCLEPGTPGSTTRFLDWKNLDFNAGEILMLESVPILVRSGRNSFYSTILPTNHTFIRYDPGCLEAVDERGGATLKMLKGRLQAGRPIEHEWLRGDILIIDNWRMLHGRESVGDDTNRRLLRILIDD